jgi:tetratricopeptide (TPR) repeat protein
MYFRTSLLILAPLTLVIAAQEAPPEKALKYHEALLKRPHNSALFERFFNAWLDEQPVETLEGFLTARAEKKGGAEWSVLARYQLRRGQEEAALASLAKAAEADPTDPVPPLEIAKLRLKRMEFEESRKHLAKVIGGTDEALSLEASKLLGKVWLREGRMDEAIKAWDAVLASHPGDEELLEDLVETAASEGEVAQALVYIEKLITASKDPYQKTLRHLRRGDLLAHAGRTDDATAAYAASLEQVGENSWLEREVLAQIEKLFRKQDRIDDLLAEFKKLAEAHPRRLLIHRQVAKLEAAQGEVDVAIGRFREVLQRSPGDRELREEFVRLLTDSEKFEDASSELEKLVAAAPNEPGLYLQLAGLRHREKKAAEVLAALKKAHELLADEPGAGVRIAGQMLQYQLTDEGEALLKQLAATEEEPAAAESLANHYGRTNRKAEAIEILKTLAKTPDVDVLIRVASSVSGLGESGEALEILKAGADKWSSESRFLSALVQTSLAAGKSADVVPQALKLVRLSTQTTELAESTGLALRVISEADKNSETRTSLEAQQDRSAAETCLLAALTEADGDQAGVEELLAPSTDPMVVHFHAALLDRRGDLPAAIAVLSRLADTEEGRKAAYFKDMAELQQRAGLTADALATVERWKLSAPGDKAAWITGSRLLRESGKPEEAVKMTRQAVSRFEGDADLAASLAMLHEEAGQWAEAESIYWRLYDETQVPADQARWAVQLAQLSQRTGDTAALEEKLRERARGNRRSVGPLLALAEVARVTQEEEKRRDLLLEAVRLQPKDIDLRLQIANLEGQLGNPERVVALLEEALPYDTSGKARSALAQAYLQQGHTLKGLRELRAMAGKQSNDPRVIEDSASALAEAKMYEEAIQFLREELSDGGDWRSKYLLAVMLEEDGREAEAVPLFLSLLSAEGELPNQKQPPALAQNQPFRGMRIALGLSKEAEEMMQLINLVSSSAYAHRANSNRHGYGFGYSGGSKSGPFMLPDNVETLRQLTLTHLGVLSKKTEDNAIATQVKATGQAHFDLIADLVPAILRGERDISKLIAAHPDAPGAIEWMLFYSGGQVAPADIRKALEKSNQVAPYGRLMGWLRVASGDTSDKEAWEAVITAAKECLASEQGDVANNILHTLASLFAPDSPASVPEEYSTVLKDLARQTLKKTDRQKTGNYSLYAIAWIGSAEEWLDEINASVSMFRKPDARAQQTQRGQWRYITRYSQLIRNIGVNNRGYNPFQGDQGIFAPPALEDLPLRALPFQVLAQMGLRSPTYQTSAQPLLTPAELLKKGELIESPLLRAWVALLAEDSEAIAKYLNVDPPAEEVGDFQLLLAVQAVREKKPGEAFDALLKARPFGASDKEYSGWINATLIGLSRDLSPEERSKRADEIQAAFLQCRSAFGVNGAPVLAAQATSLGYEDLARRLQPPVPVPGSITQGKAAAISSRSTSGSSGSSRNITIEQIAKLQSEGKHEAAARQVLQAYRTAQTNRSGNRSYETRRLLDPLNEEVKNQLLKLAEPGDSKSVVKRFEYADLCVDLKMPDRALATIEGLYAERPDDGAVISRYALLLPPEKKDLRLSLMTMAARSEEFAGRVSDLFDNLGNRSNDSKELTDLIESITEWIEVADPDEVKNANLTWVAYYGRNFYTGISLHTIRSSSQTPQNKDLRARQEAVGKRLALGMLRHPKIAEEGFRLLSAGKAWEVPPEELDRAARQIVASATDLLTPQFSYNSYFMLVRGNSSSSGGETLDGYSSVSWLVKRLNAAKSPDEILPPDYLNELRETDPRLGEVVTALRGLKTVVEVKKLMESEIMSQPSNGYRPQSSLAGMLRQGVIGRAAKVPGVIPYLVESMAKLPPVQMGRNFNGQSLITAALNASAEGSPKDRESVAKAVAKLFYGENPEWDNPSKSQAYYNSVNMLQSVLRDGVSPEAQLRIASAFYRAGIPTGSGEWALLEPFNNKRFSSKEEAEAYFESIGWLEGVDSWSPLAGWSFANVQGSNPTTFARVPLFLNDRVSSYLRFEKNGKTEFINYLKDRKKGRFGSLMTAATLAEGPERTLLTDQALTEFSKEISKLPPSRIEEISLIVPWASEKALAKLPSSLRQRVSAAEEQRRKEITKQADAYLANKGGGPQRYQSPFDEIRELFTSLVVLDTAKAAEVFLEADRRFTASLTRGGRFSNYTNDELEISMRDAAFQNLFYERSSHRHEIQHAIAILNVISASDSGQNFTYSSGYSGSGRSPDVFTHLGERIVVENHQLKSMAAHAEAMAEMKPELKTLHRVFFFNGFLLRFSASPSTAETLRKQLADKRKTDAEGARFGEAVLGVLNWEQDTPEIRINTVKLLREILTDPQIPVAARLGMSVQASQKVPAILKNTDILAAIASVYEAYCSEDRSAVNPLSIALFKTLSTIHLPPEAAPALNQFSKAFWNNANAPKPAGHSKIPSTFLPDLFSVAVTAGDNESLTRLGSQGSDKIRGNLIIILKLLSIGNFQQAEQLMPLDDQLFSGVDSNTVYTKNMETWLRAYADAANPELLVRLEGELLRYDSASGDQAPQEDRADRAIRVVEMFKKINPKAPGVRLGILSAARENNQHAAVLLSDEILAWSKERTLAKIMDLKRDANNQSSTSPVSIMASRQMALYYGGMMIAVGRGDVSLLKELQKTIHRAAATENNENGAYSIARIQIDDLTKICALWTVILASRDETSAFGETAEVYRDLIPDALKLRGNNSQTFKELLTLCHFTARWSGKPQIFTEAFAALDSEIRKSNELEGNDPLTPFLSSLKKAKSAWVNPGYFKPYRLNFLNQLFSNPEMAEVLATNGNWLGGFQSSLPPGELQELAATQNPSWLPEVRVRLGVFHAGALREAGKTKEAIEAYRKCSDEIAQRKDDSLYQSCLINLGELLLEEGDAAAAQKAIEPLSGKEIGGSLKNRYLKVMATLELSGDEKAPEAKEPAPAEK